jgi:beta-glucanase (GH16 family)
MTMTVAQSLFGSKVTRRSMILSSVFTGANITRGNAMPDIMHVAKPEEEHESPDGIMGHEETPQSVMPTTARAAGLAIPRFDLTPDYIEVFGDNFRTSNLDMRKWWTRYIFANGQLDYLNDEWQRYRENGNHVMTDQGLKLTALRHNGYYWPSGMIRSKPCFNISDGNDWYFEARCKSPGGLGIWTAFWLAADQRPADHGDWSKMPFWPPEIDIFEIVNNGKEDTVFQLQTNAHVRDWNNNPQQLQGLDARPDFNWQWKYWWAPFSFADDFHLFSLHYRAPVATWYCDREMVMKMNYLWVNDDRQPSGPAHVLMNFAVGGHGWAGRHGVDNEAFPQSFDIDWVKVYQRLPQGVIGHDLLPK